MLAPPRGPCDWFPSCKDKGFIYEYENMLGAGCAITFATSTWPSCATQNSRRRHFAAP